MEEGRDTRPVRCVTGCEVEPVNTLVMHDRNGELVLRYRCMGHTDEWHYRLGMVLGKGGKPKGVGTR